MQLVDLQRDKTDTQWSEIHCKTLFGISVESSKTIAFTGNKTVIA